MNCCTWGMDEKDVIIGGLTAQVQALASHIGPAQHRIVVITPGIRKRAAQALAEVKRRIDPNHISIVLDSDEQVFRFG